MYGLIDIFSEELLSYPVTFVFVFAVTFGLLEFVSKKNQGGFLPSKVNVLLALVFSMVAIAYQPILSFIWSILPIATVLFAVIFFAIFLINVFGGEKNAVEDTTVPTIVLGLLLLVIGTLWNKFIPALNLPYINRGDLLWIIGLVIVGIVFFSAYKSKSSS